MLWRGPVPWYLATTVLSLVSFHFLPIINCLAYQGGFNALLTVSCDSLTQLDVSNMSLQTFLAKGFCVENIPPLDHIPLSPLLFCCHSIKQVVDNFLDLKTLNNRDLLTYLNIHPDVSQQIGRLSVHLFSVWMQIPWYPELRSLIRLIR